MPISLVLAITACRVVPFTILEKLCPSIQQSLKPRNVVVNYAGIVPLILFLVFGSGCSTNTPFGQFRKEPIYNAKDRLIPRGPDKITLDQIDRVFFSAGRDSGWLMVRTGPGHYTGERQLKSHAARIDINFDEETYSIVYHSSAELLYDGSEIHKTYNLWIRQLELRIGSELSEMTRKIAAEPAPSGAPKNGTGFAVNGAGHVLTNYHVLKGCRRYWVEQFNFNSFAKLLATDATSDLALLSLNIPTASEPAKFRSGGHVKLGADIVAVGFPLSGILGTGLKATSGNVSATTGFFDDARNLQFTAPIQPGNSGGPLLDESGNVVGIVSSKLREEFVLKTTGTLAQTVNIAIKSSIATTFLDTHKIEYTTADSVATLKRTDVVENAEKYVVQVSCR